MNTHFAPPDLAMSFSHDAVLLERRDGHDWRPLGEARFSARTMAEDLAALRRAAGIRPGSPDTVLVIPDDQILYCTLTVPVGSDTRAVIGRALEEMTPCDAADLAFDWCPSENGDIETLRVAAVARRTLDEAEEFARAQGFRPQGFTARPGDGRFDGQPDFGPSRLAGEDMARSPFSASDLRQARVTEPTLDASAPSAPPAPADAPLPVSRIVAHVVPDRVAAAAPSPAPASPAAPDPAAPAPAAPDTASGVIRHGEPAVRRPGERIAPRVLAPRAQAVPKRAGQAGAERDANRPARDTPGRLAAVKRLHPGRLAAFTALLVLGLAAAWIGLGRPSDAPQVADASVAPLPEAASVAQPAAEAARPAAAVAAADEAPVEAPVEAAIEAPVEEAPDEAPAPRPAIAATPSPVSTALAPPVQPAETKANPPSAGAVPPDAPTAGEAPAAAAPASAAPAAALAERPDAERPDRNLNPAPTRATAAQGFPVATAPADADAATAAVAASPAVSGPAMPEGAALRETATAPAAAAPAPAARLASSARPPRVAPVRASLPAAMDVRPAIPAVSGETAGRAIEPGSAAPRVAGSRPPRPAATRPAQPPAPPPAPSPALNQAPAPAAPSDSQPASAGHGAPAPAAARPPARPARLGLIEEGSRAEDREQLTQAERKALTRILRDLRTAQAGDPGLGRAEGEAAFRLAEARPARKPVAVGGPSQRAVERAVAATASTAPVAKNSAASAPAAGVTRSARPPARPGETQAARQAETGDGARPGGKPGAGNASLSGAAIDRALAAAVSDTPSLPGAIALTALRSSALPPRRAAVAADAAAADAAAAAASAAAASAAAAVAAATVAPVATLAPSGDGLRAAAQAQAEEAALAEQRRQDAELQAQAEARARSRATQDAQAEAQARAAAEARARAQAEAEARAAASRQQRYAPPEAENEPEVAALAIPDGRTPTTAGNAATVKDGIRINRTQIIGTIGAGKASRALVRLSNGRVLTLRLGDRINGGTITEIGNSRITFVKGGQAQALSVLGGQ